MFRITYNKENSNQQGVLVMKEHDLEISLSNEKKEKPQADQLEFGKVLPIICLSWIICKDKDGIIQESFLINRFH